MAMMLTYMDPTKAPMLKFEAVSWCPMAMFGVDLDIIPWGVRTTSVRS